MILLENHIAATPANFRQAEDGLLEQTQGQSALWSGRAATALYHAYQVAMLRRPDVAQAEVIMPSMMCTTAANTALLSGNIPRFADVDANSGLMSLETVQARFTENTVAVVVIHLLGHLVDIDRIAAWCKANNLILIEDPTQALGAHYPDGRYAGSVGDMTVFSFNRTKIMTVGNGVLIANTPESDRLLQQVLEKKVNFPIVADSTRQQLALSQRNLHHALVGLFRLREIPYQQIATSFQMVRDAYEPLYLRPANPTIDLNAAWDALPASLAHRLEMANIYAQRLQSHHWQNLSDFQQSAVCWRFSLLIDSPEQQVAFSEAVRHDGFHVSNLYWSTNQFFNPADDCPNADSFGRRIVNLWVDDSVDADYVQRCCDSLLQHEKLLMMAQLAK
ncbi:MAG: DegT/DnrJ/EryC1/StrS family aminotransferase [Anaerolineae bacterium]|nr:DegT/DnrJ/EryC1/StrS family aminotransferase [Anaerolineae bacterium]MDQ7036000.1 DegT/DnrJ/EryC1/StrS family aminotransferase [Anaerolineae bacterium]